MDYGNNKITQHALKLVEVSRVFRMLDNVYYMELEEEEVLISINISFVASFYMFHTVVFVSDILQSMHVHIIIYIYIHVC